MNYTSLISKKKQYKYSVNICFDLRNKECLENFIPTPKTAQILREYLGSIIRSNSGIHSRILYGSYGTGKSHLLTVMSAVLSHFNTDDESFNHFIHALSQYDEELSQDIQKYVKTQKPYLVIPVYSDCSDFEKCVTFSIKKELNQHGISVCFKGFFDEALALTEKWTTGGGSILML